MMHKPVVGHISPILLVISHLKSIGLMRTTIGYTSGKYCVMFSKYLLIIFMSRLKSVSLVEIYFQTNSFTTFNRPTS